MNQHCFLLDGKTIPPIDDHHQLFIPVKLINTIENKYCSCCQRQYRSVLVDHQYPHSIDEKLKSIHHNKHCQVDEEDFYSRSFQSMTKLTEDKHVSNQIPSRKIAVAQRTHFKHHRFNAQMNNNKDKTQTCEFIRLIYHLYSLLVKDLITRVIPSINYPIDSTQINNNQSSSAITIIIKPFTLLHEKPSLDERKNSSSSLKTPTKRISTSLSDQMLTKLSPKRRLSTFRDTIRPILPVKTALVVNENTSSTILQSRTLLDIYRNKKQDLIEK
jgi:hypothetical protein